MEPEWAHKGHGEGQYKYIICACIKCKHTHTCYKNTIVLGKTDMQYQYIDLVKEEIVSYNCLPFANSAYLGSACTQNLAKSRRAFCRGFGV